jgi:hypothetical protein
MFENADITTLSHHENVEIFTILGIQGWSLYKGLTVFAVLTIQVPLLFTVDMFRHFGSRILNSQIKSPFWEENWHFGPFFQCDKANLQIKRQRISRAASISKYRWKIAIFSLFFSVGNLWGSKTQWNFTRNHFSSCVQSISLHTELTLHTTTKVIYLQNRTHYSLYADVANRI